MNRAVAGGFVAVAFVVTAETAGRVVPPPSPETVPPPGTIGEILLNGNPWLLWELIPGAHEEKGAKVTVNALGFRDRERGLRTRPRAMTLGDSSVYGFGVDDDEVFTSLLEARADADFVNAGVPGYSSLQSLIQLESRGRALEPDLLLVANLWSDNNFDSFRDRDLLASYADYSASWAASARDASAALRWMDWWLRVGPRAEAAKKVGWQVGGEDARSGYRRVAISDYTAALDRFCEIGPSVVYVLLANREDLSPVSPQPAWAPYRAAMRAVAENCGAALVDLPAAFRASGRSADALFLDLMHPTPAGHRLMADAIAALGWPATPVVTNYSGETSPPPDPFEGHGLARPDLARGADAFTLVGTLRVPRYASGRITLDVTRPGDDRAPALGSTSLVGPGPMQVKLSERVPTAMFRIYLDTAGDGPTAGDETATIGPLDIPEDGRIDLDFSSPTHP